MLGVPTERITLRRAVELGELAALGGAPARPERAWLNPSIQTAIEESMRVLGPVVDLVRQRREAMESVFRPEALEQDLGGLEVRFRETHTGMRRWSSAARADRRLLKTLTVNGIAGNDTFTATSLAGVTDLTTVRLAGFDGTDTFTVTPAAAVQFSVNGGPPGTAPGDTLTIDPAGTANPTLTITS